jgi:hypothetical protein
MLPLTVITFTQLPCTIGKNFTEGWVEFEDKSVAKSVALMLNGNQIGGKKRSAYYYDIWNIRWVSCGQRRVGVRCKVQGRATACNNLHNVQLAAPAAVLF